MLFVNKQKKVEELLADYRHTVSDCLILFDKSFREYLAEPDRVRLEKNFLKIHKAESRADDIRREVEVMMYSKALFPESRGDILGLLETMDRVPNQAESTVQMLLNQQIEIPEIYRDGVGQLIRICHRCVSAMLEGASKLFTNYTNATVAVGKIDELESEADNIEESIVKQIFSSDLDGFKKIVLRDLIKQIASVSDYAENVGDRIRIIVAKRGI